MKIKKYLSTFIINNIFFIITWLLVSACSSNQFIEEIAQPMVSD